ncbi:hypothetical protein Daus18300_005483 [Diaporthe australafricana]|uniref:Uncharacterized protein n=1 Tax=Diaporthe australafricana TaxID=127596 RepID=A0ABR3X0Z3_9PEZI
MSLKPTRKRPLDPEEEALDVIDHPAAKAMRDLYLTLQPTSELESEDTFSDDEVQGIPATAKPKPRRRPRARPQATEPLIAEEQYAETLRSIDKTWNAMAKKFWKEVNDFASGVGGTGHGLRHMDSLMLELIRLRLPRDEDPPLFGGDGFFTTEPHTYAQDADGKVAALNIERAGRYAKKNQKKRDGYRADDLRSICETQRKRREGPGDWMGNARRIDRCGLDDYYFGLSIQKLSELKVGAAAVPARYATKLDEENTFLVHYRPAAEQTFLVPAPP